jgi:hypothetical protein
LETPHFPTTENNPIEMPITEPNTGPIWRNAFELSFTEATNLLDWLEAHGVKRREVMLEKSGMITVRWFS